MDNATDLVSFQAPADLAIGDVVPLEPGWNRTAWQHQRRLQGHTGAAGSKCRNPDSVALQKVLAERADARARAECTVEQAKLVLRRRGYVVYRADVTGGPADAGGWAMPC